MDRPLSVASGGVVFTTIQEFLPEKGEKMPCLSERRNIIVIADEAHRSQYDFTRFFQPKTEDSVGDVEIDSEFLEFFRRLQKVTPSEFVVASKVAPRVGATYSHYRCQAAFEHLTAWLRKHGVTGNNPLHSLRKEYGSQICAQYGIYAASRALRHSNIQITSLHYLDQKRKVTVGLGHLLRSTSESQYQ